MIFRSVKHSRKQKIILTSWFNFDFKNICNSFFFQFCIYISGTADFYILIVHITFYIYIYINTSVFVGFGYRRFRFLSICSAKNLFRFSSVDSDFVGVLLCSCYIFCKQRRRQCVLLLSVTLFLVVSPHIWSRRRTKKMLPLLILKFFLVCLPFPAVHEWRTVNMAFPAYFHYFSIFIKGRRKK